MSTKAKHTPVPWSINHDIHAKSICRDEPFTDIAVCFGSEGQRSTPSSDEGDSNAEFIVLACNAHEDVVKALEAFFEWYDKPSVDGELVLASELLRAALAKARGG